MSTPRAQNPSVRDIPTNTQRPQRDRTSPTHSRSHDYMERNRREDPIPPVNNKPTPILRLSNCKILTPQDSIQIDKEFEFQCDATFLHNSTPTRAKVEFDLHSSYDEAGKASNECRYGEFSGYLDLNKKTQTVKIYGKLPPPQSKPSDNTLVTYKLCSRHQEAESDACSDEVSVRIRYSQKPQNKIINRSVKITIDGKTMIIGARYILCEDGKAIKKAKLDNNSSFSYKAKPESKYSIYLVQAGHIFDTKANKSEPFYDLPDESSVVLQLERQKVFFECPAMGGEPISRLDPNNNRIDPTPTGEYTVEMLTPHLSAGKYLNSMIHWGEETQIINGIFQVKRNNKWIAGTKIHPELTAEYIQNTYDDLYRDAEIKRISPEIPKRWILNDFGPIAAYLFKDEDGDRIRDRSEIREQEMLHTTPVDELRKAHGLEITLGYSHGCIHVEPSAMIELISGKTIQTLDQKTPSSAILKPGVTVQTHSYDEMIPSYTLQKTAKPPFSIHFFPQADTILVYGS